MSILSINCIRLGNPNEVDGLRDLIRREAPTVVFLAETKLSSGEFGRIRDRLGEFDGLVVDSRGLALFWRKNLEVELRTMSLHHIDVEVKGGLGEELWRLTGF